MREKPAVGRRKPVPRRSAPPPPTRRGARRVSCHDPVYDCRGAVPLPSTFVQLPSVAQSKDSKTDAKSLQPKPAAVGKETRNYQALTCNTATSRHDSSTDSNPQPTSAAVGVCKETRNPQVPTHSTAVRPHDPSNDCNGTVSSAFPAAAQPRDCITEVKNLQPTATQNSPVVSRPPGPRRRPVPPRRLSSRASSYDPINDYSGTAAVPPTFPAVAESKESINEAKKLQPTSATAKRSSPPGTQPLEPPVPPRRLFPRSTASLPSTFPADAQSKDSTDSKKPTSATATKNSPSGMPVPPRRSSSLREFHSRPMEQGREQRKDSVPVRPILFSLREEGSGSDLVLGHHDDGMKGGTLPRAKPRQTIARAEGATKHAAGKKQRNPHIIDARPTRYETVDYKDSRQSWLQKIRSKRVQHKDEPVEPEVNPYAPCIKKRRHHSAMVPLRTTTPQDSTSSPPLPKRPASMPDGTLFQRLTIACGDSMESKRPQMPLPTSPCSPPLPPITESDHDDCGDTGDSGNIEDDDDLSPYSVVKKDKTTGRLISVAVNPGGTRQPCPRLQDTTDEEADEYIYPLTQWNSSTNAQQLSPSENAGMK